MWVDDRQRVGYVQGSLDELVAEGQISGPIVHQLPNALRQAGRHVAEGRAKAATAALDRLEQPKRTDQVSDEALARLTSEVTELVDMLA